jgi:hypothetical protein
MAGARFILEALGPPEGDKRPPELRSGKALAPQDDIGAVLARSAVLRLELADPKDQSDAATLKRYLGNLL